MPVVDDSDLDTNPLISYGASEQTNENVDNSKQGGAATGDDGHILCDPFQ